MKLVVHDVPAGGDYVSLGTVCGVPLESGERVVYFVAPDHTKTKRRIILWGALLTLILFGFVLIAYGAMYERWGLRFVALTNKRIIVGKGERGVRTARLAEIADIRGEGNAGGADKTDSRYWVRSDGIVVEARGGGALFIDKSADPQRLGPALANALYTAGYFDRVPTAHCPP